MLGAKRGLCQSLFLNDKYSDVVVKVINRKDGYTYTYPAHSLVLNMGSEKLRERMDLNVEDDKKILTFVDLEAEIVLLLLRFLYFGELPTVRSEEQLMQLLGTANKLHIKLLQDETQSRILQYLKVENACRLLETSTNQCDLGHGSPEVADACRRIVLNYGHIIFASDFVLDLSRSTMDSILQSDTLNVLDEETIFRGLWKWGKMGCCKLGTELTDQQIVDYLGDLLKHVRYSALANTDFVPKLVKDRYFPKKAVSCCLAENGALKNKSRCPFKQPADLLKHCTSIQMDIFTSRALSNTTDGIASHFPVLCAQLSFDADLYLCALSLEATYCNDELMESDSFVMVITAEATGQEVSRQEIHWEEVSSSKVSSSERRNNTFFATVRLSAPLRIGHGHIHSVQLVSQTVTTSGTNRCNWSFRTHQVLRRAIPLDNFLTVNVHSLNFVALTSIFVIPFKNVVTV